MFRQGSIPTGSNTKRYSSWSFAERRDDTKEMDDLQLASRWSNSYLLTVAMVENIVRSTRGGHAIERR